MKIGILANLYNCPDKVEPALRPWVNLQKENRLDIDITVVSTARLGDPEVDNKPTIAALSNMLVRSKAFIVSTPVPVSWDTHMNMPLSYLLEQNYDLTWMVGEEDELSEWQIFQWLEKIKAEPDVVWWYKVPTFIFRNQVGNKVLKGAQQGQLFYQSIDEKRRYSTLVLKFKEL